MIWPRFDLLAIRLSAELYEARVEKKENGEYIINEK
jgi:hypothetical protein